MDTRKRRKDGVTTLSPLYDSLQSSPKRARVHAQRKFAQGSQPNSPALTPVKEIRDLRERLESRTRLNLQTLPIPHVIEPPTRPKTEDFLTFLCFRKTPMLPPELEIFETPQLLDIPAPDESRSQSPVRDEKLIKPIKKKEEVPEKKICNKDSVKKNIEDNDVDCQNVSPTHSTRVTRSSASLIPIPSFLSSPSSDTSPNMAIPKRKLTRKQLLLKKAALLKSQGLRANRRSFQLHLRSTGDKESGSSLSMLESPNKGIKSTKILSLRKKEHISRVLRRLGTSELSTPDLEGRVTRSKVEVDSGIQVDQDTSSVHNAKINSSSDLSESLKPLFFNEANHATKAEPKSDSHNKDSYALKLRKDHKTLNLKIRNKKLLSAMKLRNAKKKSSLDNKRITRRLLLHLKDGSNSTTKNGVNIADANLRDQTSSCQNRCTRSASDSGPSVEEIKPSKNIARKISDRSKSCDEKISETSKKQIKSKVCKDENLTDDTGTIIRSRPSRKTKQVAEIYLELISKKLAKESLNSKNCSNEDELLDDDNISISSIKELETLSKDESKDIQRCVQEFAEKHDKGVKSARNETKWGQSKPNAVKTACLNAPKSHCEPEIAQECEKTKLLPEKKRLKAKKFNSISPHDKSTLRNAIVDGTSTMETQVPKEIQNTFNSTQSPKTINSSHKIHHNLRPTRNTQVLKSNSSNSLRQMRLSRSPSASLSNSPVQSPKKSQDKAIRPTTSPSTTIRKKRALSDNTNQSHKEKPLHRLSLDCSSSMISSESDNSLPNSKCWDKTCDREKCDHAKLTIKSVNACSSSVENSVSVPSVCEKMINQTSLLQTNVLPKTESDPMVKKEIISVIPDKVDIVLSSKRLIDKVKSMTLSPRSKRTLSLDTLDKKKCSSNFKSTKLKKFSSLDNVATSSKTEHLPVKRPQQLKLDLDPSRLSNNQDTVADEAASAQVTLKRSMFGRRRNSVHDEAKLNEVLGSIAEDFKKDMDDSLYDKLEKDLNSGNKSPDKANKTILERVIKVEKESCHIDSNLINSTYKFPSNAQPVLPNSLEIEPKISHLNSKATSSESSMETSTASKLMLKSDDLANHNLGTCKTPVLLQTAELRSNMSTLQPTSEVCSTTLPPAATIEAVNLRASPVSVMDNNYTVSPLLSSDISSRSSPLPSSEVNASAPPLPSSVSSPSTPGRKSSGKKLCEVVRNLQVRKQAESPLNYNEMDTPTFIQDLKDIEAEKQKQVSEEKNADANIDLSLAPAPNISTSVNAISDEISKVTKSPTTHSCTFETDAQKFTAISDECEPNILNESLGRNATDIAQHDNKICCERIEQIVTTLASVYSSLSNINSNLAPILTVANAATLPNTNINQTSYMSVLPVTVTSESMLSMPISNLNYAVPTLTINPGPLTNLRHPTTIGINVATNQLPGALVSSRIPHIAAPTVISEFKSFKNEHITQKTSAKQILIAPKPSKNSNKMSSHGVLGSLSGLKHLPKPVQIAPKLPSTGTSMNSQVNHMHASAPIIPGSPMGHMIQGVPHPVQTLQAIQAMPQGVQPLQAMAPNFSSIPGMTSAVPAVITQTVALNASQLVTPSPTKLITQPMPIFVTSSMPNVVASPFDIAMQNHLQGNVGAVARVVTQNMIENLPTNHKPHGPIMPIDSITQPLVTLPSGNNCSNVISSLVPFHPSLQAGHPTQFLAVNMMPMASSHLPISGTGHIASSVGPLICSQAVGVATSSGVHVPCSVASISGPLNIIPSGPLLPFHDVNIGSSGLVHPISCASANDSATQVLVSAANDQNCSHMGLVISSSLSSHLPDNAVRLGSQPMVLGLSDGSNQRGDLKKEEFGIVCNSSNVENDADITYLNADNTDVDEYNMDISTETNEENDASLVDDSGDSINDSVNSPSKGEELSLPKAVCPEISCSSLASTISIMPINVSTGTSHLEVLPFIHSPGLSPVFPQISSHQKIESSTTSSEDCAESSLDLKINEQNSKVSKAIATKHQAQILPEVKCNFVYSSTTVVIPKTTEHSMTSPRAITNVSQSSPPYVLSTSASNEYYKKASKSDILPSLTNSSQKAIHCNNTDSSLTIENSNINQKQNEGTIDEGQHSATEKDISNEPISMILSKFVSSSVTVTPMPISCKSSVILQSPASNIVQSNWSPKSFYSANIIKSSKVEKNMEIKKTKQKVDVVKATLTFDKNKLPSKLDPSLDYGSKKNAEVMIRQSDEHAGVKDAKENLGVEIVKPLNQLHGKLNKNANGKEHESEKNVTLIKGGLETSKKPIIKKRTLFKTKHCEEQKKTDAFSPLNESSVYAFEPDLDAPLEVTTPFYQRIKNIQPSPQAVKRNSSYKFQNKISSQLFEKSLKIVSDKTKKEKSIRLDFQPEIQNFKSNMVLEFEDDKEPTLPRNAGAAKKIPKRKTTQITNRKGTFSDSIKELSISISLAASNQTPGTSDVHAFSPENPGNGNHVYRHPTPIKNSSINQAKSPTSCSKLLFSHDKPESSNKPDIILCKSSDGKLNSGPALGSSKSTHVPSLQKTTVSHLFTEDLETKLLNNGPSKCLNIIEDKAKMIPILKDTLVTVDKPTKSLATTSIAKEHLGLISSNLQGKFECIIDTKSKGRFERNKKGSRPFPSKANLSFKKDFKSSSNTLPLDVAIEKVPLKYISKSRQVSINLVQDNITPSSNADLCHSKGNAVFSKGQCKETSSKKPNMSFDAKTKPLDLNIKAVVQKVTKVAISEAYNIPDSEENDNTGDASEKISKSTSIAIQCDLDDSQSDLSQDEIKGNESGTQTEKSSKFPLPPSASPFYYLPLAMATLGEKLPAQLVQQMLAKTQGLVGAAEAGLILQQAAQLAQQYHKNSEDDGSSSLRPSSAVKPISPKSGSIALQKALRANLASMAQAEISVAQNTGGQLPSQATAKFASSLLPLQAASLCKQIGNSASHKGLLKILIPESEQNLNIVTNCKVNKSFTNNSKNEYLVNKSEETVSKDCANKSKDSKEKEISDYSNSKHSRQFPATKVSSKIINSENNTSKKPDSDAKQTTTEPVIRKPVTVAPKVKRAKMDDILVKRRSGRSTTLASTKATEFDLHEAEEIRRNRRAKRAAAVLAKEEGWSSSSEPPLSPTMSPDVLRGWPPPRLTSPTPSQSSEGTTASSTPSQRSRVSAPQSRRHSPASSIDSRRPIRYSNSSSAPVFPSDPVIDPEPLCISDNPKLARAPSFFPTEEEFTEPLDFIEKIRPEAEQFGLCRIVPPSNFRPECRVNDDMRFTAYRQYTHRMMKRWGPSDRTLCAIKRCLAKQNIELISNPLIGGLELDLVSLYNVVEDHGGLMTVIEEELWAKVSDVLRIPKSAQDRVTKLDTIYCKYLLPYAMLSSDERQQLLYEVDAIHSRSQGEESSKRSGSVHSSDNEEDDEYEPLDCIVKGKSTALSAFYRIARNISSQWQPDPAGLELDERYWEIVKKGNSHVCVHAASIDTAEHCYGFPSQKNSSSAKHPWNLKNLVQNPNSVLRSMGNVIGVTAPTLHVGMMFSTVCWYRDPHSLPWVEYLHTGASKIWYGVAANNEDKFQSAMKKLVPDFIKDSPVWLPSDTAMVSPDDLVKEEVKVSRVVQEPGQFVVVFPGAFTSSVCSGYLISESAFFARPQYFDRVVASFKTLFECFEPSMFSLDRLALSVASDSKATIEALMRSRPLVQNIVEREKKERMELLDLGLSLAERFSNPAIYRKKKNRYEDDEENTCEICRQHLYVSFVFHENDEISYCLVHAINFIKANKNQLESCKLLYTYSLPELTSSLKQLDERIMLKNSKKGSSLAGKRSLLADQDSSTSSSNL